ncbi:sensor histidine kinase [Streptomyces kanamyceticus]|uniref:histidine kinase n=1 Tax=Streptomyces kanamyceticus TaxID=1967 RepID=A0A5J6GMV2_STRKN|nr:histidine kinase [Streptomyces kanamyceticus]QEU96759.1 sensor histidine kinase [Streptomyces kanamyceticus]
MRLHRRTAERGVASLACAELLTVAGTFDPLGLVVCSVALLALPLRHRFPLSTLAVTLPATVTEYLWLPAMLAMFVVACRASPRVIGGCGVLLFAAALVPWPPAALLDHSRPEVLTMVEGAGLLSLGPIVLGLLIRTRDELRHRLADLAATQHRERWLESQRAVTRERARLARDMHDTVSHHVGIIAVQSGVLSATERDGARRADIEVVREHSVRALEELRDMVGVLRGTDAGAAAAVGRTRLADLHGLTAESLLDVGVRIAVAPGTSWDPALEAVAFRIVQEALNNVRKHAPGAPVQVSVLTPEGHDALVVEVSNGPPGTDRTAPALPAGGHGLVGLRERAALVGGRVVARPTAEGGFTVRAELPL